MLYKVYTYADVQAFRDAKSALKYAEEHGCDVLLCEINPPRLAGLFLAEKIKETNPKVNIIFVTVCLESEHTKAEPIALSRFCNAVSDTVML